MPPTSESVAPIFTGLRTRFLKEHSSFVAKLSGGDHWPDWPPQAIAFLKEFLPLRYVVAAGHNAERGRFIQTPQRVA